MKENAQNIFWFFSLFLGAALIVPDIAHAGYLDPGAGSTLAQVLAASLAGISKFFRKIVSLFK